MNRSLALAISGARQFQRNWAHAHTKRQKAVNECGKIVVDEIGYGWRGVANRGEGQI
jgi:hypothetical protein